MQTSLQVYKNDEAGVGNLEQRNRRVGTHIFHVDPSCPHVTKMLLWRATTCHLKMMRRKNSGTLHFVNFHVYVRGIFTANANARLQMHLIMKQTSTASKRTNDDQRIPKRRNMTEFIKLEHIAPKLLCL